MPISAPARGHFRRVILPLLAGIWLIAARSPADEPGPEGDPTPTAGVVSLQSLPAEEVVVDDGQTMTGVWTDTDPQRYVVFDVLGMQRNNALKDGPLVVENGTQFTALQTNMLQSSVAPGVRVLYGDYGCDGIGWETGYLGLWNMYSTSRVESPNGLLQAPGQLGFASPALSNATGAGFSGVTSLQSADINLVYHMFDGGQDPRSPRPSQRVAWYDGGHLDWLTGFRWGGLDDVGTVGFSPAGATAPNTYTAHTSSNLFAGQVGVRGRMEFQEWALESWIKVGLAGTSLSQTQSFQDQLAPLDPYRPTGSSWKGGVGMIADANLSGIYRIDRVWGVRFGYNLIWLTGVALAPDQFNWTASTDPATTLGIDNTGSMLLSGANAGLEARW
jgi:hypothetical protein